MTKHAVAARYVFDGEILHDNAAVIINGSRITAVVPRADVPLALPVRDLPEGVWLVSGFIDIQVNGGGDVLFNDAPTPETIRKIVAAHRASARQPAADTHQRPHRQDESGARRSRRAPRR